MLLEEVHQLVGEVDGIDPSCRDRDVLCAALADVARLRAWLESRHLAMANQLAKVVADLEPVMTDATRMSRRDARRTIARAETVEAMPPLREALTSGDISGAHIDVIGRALRGLEPPEREALAERAGLAHGAGDPSLGRRARPPREGRGPEGAERTTASAGSNASAARLACAPGSMTTACGAYTAASIPSPGSVSPARSPRPWIGSSPSGHQLTLPPTRPSVSTTCGRKPSSLSSTATRPTSGDQRSSWSSTPPRATVRSSTGGSPSSSRTRSSPTSSRSPRRGRWSSATAPSSMPPVGSTSGRTTRIANRAQRRALRGRLPDVRHPGLHRLVRLVQAPPRRMVGARRPNRFGQFATPVHGPPPRRARVRLAAHHRS